MALDTFANLKTAIADWLDRDDLTAVIPDFITLLEAELDRRDAVIEERRSTLTLDAQIVSLPTGFKEPLDGFLYFDDGTRYGRIEIVSPDQLADEKLMRGTDTGYPRKAAIINDGTQLMLAPVPDQAYTAKIFYAATLDALSDSNTSNWVLNSHPDVYLFGSLLQAEPYMKFDERIQVWKQKYEEALEQMRTHHERRKWGARLTMRPKRSLG